jgi:hypothetical protein
MTNDGDMWNIADKDGPDKDNRGRTGPQCFRRKSRMSRELK